MTHGEIGGPEREQNIFIGVFYGRYLPWLDCLRGIAAVLVIFSHFVWTPYAEQQGLLHYIFSPGQFGVALFFCISGFIIPMSVSKDGFGRLTKFLIHRLFRLYPIYWIAIILAACLYGASFESTFVNLTMIQRYLGSRDILPVAWTLQVELAFYGLVACCIAVPAVRRRRATLPVLLVSLAVICVVQAALRYFLGIRTPMGLSNGLFIMIFSWVVFFRPTFIHRGKFVRKLPWMLLALVQISWFWSLADDWGGGELFFWSAFGQIVSYSVAVAVFAWASETRTLNNANLIWCGQISYSLYLFHEPVRHLAAIYVDPLLGALCGIGIATVATFMISHFAFKWIEKPMVIAGRSVANATLRFVYPVPPSHSVG